VFESITHQIKNYQNLYETLRARRCDTTSGRLIRLKPSGSTSYISWNVLSKHVSPASSPPWVRYLGHVRGVVLGVFDGCQHVFVRRHQALHLLGVGLQVLRKETGGWHAIHWYLYLYHIMYEMQGKMYIQYLYIYIYIMVDWVLDDANGKVDGRWYLENLEKKYIHMSPNFSGAGGSWQNNLAAQAEQMNRVQMVLGLVLPLLGKPRHFAHLR